LSPSIRAGVPNTVQLAQCEPRAALHVATLSCAVRDRDRVRFEMPNDLPSGPVEPCRMTEQLGDGRIGYVQSRIRSDVMNRLFPADVSGALASDPRLDVDQHFVSIFVRASDGLSLHVRKYGFPVASAVPVVCLPGLARTAADFHVLAMALAADPANPRLVLALDYRGHGQSQYDRNSNNYTIRFALADLSTILVAFEITSAIFIGTSFGGVLAMMGAQLPPAGAAGIILNDIGPVMEPRGLMRIKSWVGKLPTARNFEEGAEILRWLFKAQFTNLGPQDWVALAKRTWHQEHGTLVPSHDAKLARVLRGLSLERLPTLWDQFDALARIPLMVIRGDNSDMLARPTLNEMIERRDQLDIVVVPDQGHAPLLAEPKVVRRIAWFVASCDRPGRRQEHRAADAGGA
jgi:pimeloyl-ACP methyl ester carboxylesterase